MPHFARHLEHHTIINPFPGIAKLEAALGHRIGARIGSNESMAKPASPLAAQFGEAMAELARLYPDPYAHGLRQRGGPQWRGRRPSAVRHRRRQPDPAGAAPVL